LLPISYLVESRGHFFLVVGELNIGLLQRRRHEVHDVVNKYWLPERTKAAVMITARRGRVDGQGLTGTYVKGAHLNSQ
jgi:hypothetical protein